MFCRKSRFIPLAVVSSWIGGKLVRYVSVEKFNLLIVIMLVGVSIGLIAQGMSGGA